MRAVIVTEPGPPESLRLGEVPDPVAGPGAVVVRVGAAGVNPVDAGNRANPEWAGVAVPFVVGYEFAGWIEAVGRGVAEFASGDPVWGMCPVRGTRWGTYAEYVEVEAAWVGHRPPSLDVAAAATVPLAGSTALQLLDRLDLGHGDAVLVHGASGGVGRNFVQLARARGVRVAGSGGRRSHALLGELGVQVILDREQGDVAAAAIDGLGARFDAVADLAGHGLLAASLAVLRDGGSAGSIVELSGDLDEAVDRNIAVHGVLVRPDRATLDRLAQAVQSTRLRPVVDAVVDPAGIEDVHRRIEAGHSTGYVVLSMQT